MLVARVVTLRWPPQAGDWVQANADTQDALPTTGEAPGSAPSSSVHVALHAPSDLFRPGDVLGGKYEIREKLGEGGMGQVYEALDRTLARRVAIKASHAQSRSSLMQEARALAALRHPSIVAVHGLSEHEGTPYVVMERVYGRTLQALLDEHRARGTFVPVDEAAELLASIADGLAVVHRAGMAHRDVKPANIMLAPGGRVVLTDFGIFQPECARNPQLSGSPHYVAPEAIEMRIGLGEVYLVDVYALGIVAYEMLTGRVPFDDGDVTRLLLMHASEPAPDPVVQRGDVPAKLSKLVLQMLAKDPKSRPQSMDEVAWQLRRLHEQPARVDSRCSILVAEDNPATSAILASMVSEALPDSEVRLARDGWAALEMLRRRPPDLLIVDIDLPVLDGIAVCERLRGSAIARSCTVIATSSHATTAQIARLRGLGFVAFVPKGTEMARKLPLILARTQRRSAGA